ncbi:MAG: IS91 family transposase [Oligoflexia bacterium]|nr:IS91 family transposase [Oligoflexia bacterium]
MRIEQPKIEMAEIFRNHRHLLGKIPKSHHKVIQDIINCRTSVLGGHQLKCNECDYTENSYNSCRNRHCPKCQYLAKMKWVESRLEDLLPCQYFHVVFTLPSLLNRLILQNKSVAYGILFQSASETLKEVAANPKNMGAEIGFIGVLHTWAQNLMDHPHIHFIVPGGGLNKEKNLWIACKNKYLLPIQILSLVFRGKFLKSIENAFDNHQLVFYGEISDLSERINFKELLTKTSKVDWVVYSKKPFAGPEQVIKYLSRYTHRIAISNYRLLKFEDGNVHFSYRDSADDNKTKTMILDVVEFMRRFLLHVMPEKFVRIRHFGMLGNRSRKENLNICRKLLDVVVEKKSKIEKNWKTHLEALTSIDVDVCPKCKKGRLLKIGFFSNLLKTG